MASPRPGTYTPINVNLYTSVFVGVSAALTFGGRYTASAAGEAAVPPIADAFARAVDQKTDDAAAPAVQREATAFSSMLMALAGVLISADPADYEKQATDACNAGIAAQAWYDDHINL